MNRCSNGALIKFQKILLNGLKPDFLKILLFPLLSEKQSRSVIPRQGLQYTGAKNVISAFSLLDNLKIPHSMRIKEIPDHHFRLRLAVAICFIGEADVHPDI